MRDPHTHPITDARFTSLGLDGRWRNHTRRARREERAWPNEHRADAAATYLPQARSDGYDGRFPIEGGPWVETPFEPAAPSIGWYAAKLGEPENP